MKILKINRKHTVNSDNIEKLVIKKDCVWVYRKEGYPKVYKTDCTLYMFRMRLTSLKLQLTDFKVENEDESSSL